MRVELKKPLLEIVRILGIALAVYVAIKFVLPLAFPFLLAFFVAKQLHPMVEKLHKKIKIKKGIISGGLLLLLLVVVLGVLWFVGKNLLEQIHNLIQNVPVYREKLIIMWKDYCIQLEGWTGIEAETLNLKISQGVPMVWESVKENVMPALMNGSISWIKGIGTLAAGSIIIAVSVLLMVKEYENIGKTMDRTVLGQTAVQVARRVYHAGGAYIKAQLIIMLVVMIICVIGLFCTGNSYALLVGIGIGLCDALPFLGTGTIFIPWAIIELLTGKYTMAAVYAVIYTIASLTRELLEPKLLGNKLGISPLAVIISVYVGICIFGLWGFALGPLSYILIKEIYAIGKQETDDYERKSESGA